mmetsp:Transcript_23491/g.93120  ORF Transcript_23491/g.93120 Transcript_23491/m.93120 type:complete len:259 (-) Transcript_23491:295-1071(-)
MCRPLPQRRRRRTSLRRDRVAARRALEGPELPEVEIGRIQLAKRSVAHRDGREARATRLSSDELGVVNVLALRLLRSAAVDVWDARRDVVLGQIHAPAVFQSKAAEQRPAQRRRSRRKNLERVAWCVFDTADMLDARSRARLSRRTWTAQCCAYSDCGTKWQSRSPGHVRNSRSEVAVHARKAASSQYASTAASWWYCATSRSAGCRSEQNVVVVTPDDVAALPDDALACGGTCHGEHEDTRHLSLVFGPRRGRQRSS